ncbi:MAG: hypothetical protein JWQ06_965 [Mucilaginibacter sp.]|nr:hypothetical protein [Mucilaginibacter sp.]
MKHIFKSGLLAIGILAAIHSQAQTHRDSGVGDKISHTTKKVGNKTSEIAAKGAAAITDKKYEGKVAPSGETVYINEHSHYYYINKKGHKVYLTKSELRDKPFD